MEDDNEGLKDLILEELTRLGVQNTSESKASQGGSRLLTINYNTNASKSGKLKSKGKRSPRASSAKSPHTKQGHSKGRDDRKHTPKSPFAAAKRKAELRKQNAKEKGLVFGRELGHVPSVCVYMSDGTQVTVAEFLVDVCNLIRRNITVEGIFRKAGSSQRQSDIKKLIDSGSSLPNSVHVIDGACLLKQFLRSLPNPLLSSEVHNKTIKCMQLGKEARTEAVTLCTMLLPLANRHTLVYLMDFLSDVVAASGSNLMDAHNLAIVLAPNLLPTSITVNNRKGAAGPLHSEDAMLATNIEILQLLIENAPRLCRLPNNVALALEHREQSRSTENLLTPSEPHPATRKKRRSASIHRLMTGLRRVVGHSSGGGGSPIRMSGSAECLDSLHLHPGIALSPMPGSGGSPRKRKSSDAFDLGLEACRMEGSQAGETISDIHNYLDTFNKEIQTGDQATSGDVAQVFVDESGQYFYQNVDGSQQQMVVVSSEGADGSEGDVGAGGADGSVMLHTEEDSLHEDGDSLSQSQVALGEDGTLQVISGMDQSETSNQVVLNTGDNNQIVTIVPSSTNPGEVSYVLIVEQSGENDKDDTVYDFNEADEGLSYESGEEDDKKMMRIIHKKSQTVTQAHMCNYCNYTSPKRYLLSRHMKSHSEERPHKCSVCERGFKTLASLQNHVNTHTGIKPHRCKFCESTFTTSGELVRHVRYIHTHEKPHKCPDCDYASVELSKLKRHMRCHTGERPYQCPHCTYASPDTFKLKRHLRIHTGEKPYECEICHARFTQSNSLKAHKLIHTGNKPVYACELCPTTCGRKTDLRIHVQKLHTSDKPLKCKKCGKAFPDRYTFKQHNKSHEGEKCFKCDLCPYASTSAKHLESHMLVHTEQKPYQCDQCDQAFRQKQLLKRHQNLYHNPAYIPPMPREKTQECPECGKAFRHKGNLIRHMAIHDPDASAQEKAQALKIGRQKRLQLINGQQVEVYTGEVDEDEIMAVEGQDGNQYVVLEVIQLQDGEGHVMMSDGIPVTDSSLDGAGVASVLGSSPLMVPETITGDTIGPIDGTCLVSDPSLLELQQKKSELKTEISAEAKKEAQKEMETCFGFDDEDEGQIHLEFDE